MSTITVRVMLLIHLWNSWSIRRHYPHHLRFSVLSFIEVSISIVVEDEALLKSLHGNRFVYWTFVYVSRRRPLVRMVSKRCLFLMKGVDYLFVWCNLVYSIGRIFSVTLLWGLWSLMSQVSCLKIFIIVICFINIVFNCTYSVTACRSFSRSCKLMCQILNSNLFMLFLQYILVDSACCA